MLGEAKDVYEDFWKDQKRFVSSDYPENSKFHDKTNEVKWTVSHAKANKVKIISKMKDEATGEIIREFIGLTSKMYSYIKDNSENCKVA